MWNCFRNLFLNNNVIFHSGNVHLIRREETGFQGLHSVSKMMTPNSQHQLTLHSDFIVCSISLKHITFSSLGDDGKNEILQGRYLLICYNTLILFKIRQQLFCFYLSHFFPHIIIIYKILKILGLELSVMVRFWIVSHPHYSEHLNLLSIIRNDLC